MSKRFQPPAVVRQPDPAAELVRRSHDERIRELQAVPIVRGNLIRDIELTDGIEIPVPHGLGRRASVFTSPPRNAADREMLVGSTNFQPVTVANWNTPNGALDYWQSTAVTQVIHIPLDGLRVGDKLTTVRLSFYAAAAANPTISLYAANTGASATLQTPTVAWTNPPTTTWTVLEATYDVTVTRGDWYLSVSCPTSGDRVRAAYITGTAQGLVQEVRSASYDPAKYTVLRADGFGATVTVDAWVF